MYANRARGTIRADFVREHQGVCADCQGEAWTLKVTFVDQKVDYTSSVLKLAFTFLVGIGWHPSYETDRLDLSFTNVPATDAFTICQVPYRERHRRWSISSTVNNSKPTSSGRR